MNRPLANQAREAPALLQRAWPTLRAQAAELVGALAMPPSTVLLCGCGDSHNASDSLSYAFRAWAGVSALGAPAMTTARYLLPDLSRDPSAVLLIGISASGETARTLEALTLGRERGLPTVAITTQSASPLAATAEYRMALEVPDFGHAPGLLSYLTALLSGLALALELAGDRVRAQAGAAIEQLPAVLEAEIPDAWDTGAAFADQLRERLPLTFLGSGPAYGAAMFAAAKLVEACGWPAWAQEAEEWAHVEYFADPAGLPMWLLSGSGRAAAREGEIEQAARQLGRRLQVSRWPSAEAWPVWAREALSPLGLWIGPCALAEELMARAGERPYRGFSGGRSSEQGGGANRVRTSERLRSLKELSGFQPRN